MKTEEKEELLEKVRNIVQEASVIRHPVATIATAPNAELQVLLLLQLRELTTVLDSVVTAINSIGTDDYPLVTRQDNYGH
jgi:hypothetical protein